MPTKTISREEFDIRLAQSTEQMRQKRSALEAQAAELEDLIERYSSVLERLEAGNEKLTKIRTRLWVGEIRCVLF